MAANDVQALQANFKSSQANRFPNPQKGVNIFEYYCLEQFSRSFALSDSFTRIHTRMTDELGHAK